jgi:hypothetical protein
MTVMMTTTVNMMMMITRTITMVTTAKTREVAGV